MIDIPALFEHVPIPSYVFRMVGDEFLLVGANARARARNPMLVSLVGRPMAQLYHDLPTALEAARSCMADGAPVVREIRLRTLDRLEANELVRLVFTRVATDLLLLHLESLAAPSLTEAALRESEERYRGLVASLPDAVTLRGLDGRILASNDAAAAMCGRKDVADMLGRIDVFAEGISLSTASGTPVGSEDWPGRRVLLTGEPEPSATYILTRPDGTQRWYRVAAQPVRSSDGHVAGSVTTYAEDTERFLAERAVSDTASRLSMALDAARMGTWEWEPGSDRGHWSAGMNEYFKLPSMESGIQAFMSRVHPDDRGHFSALAEQVLGGAGEETFEHEWRVVGDDGVTRWARTRGRLQRREGGVRLSGTILDITERRALEEELTRAHRLESIGRLAGGLAHDFNNLLAAMLGSLELLEDVVPSHGKEDLETVRHGAQRARELTAQLLAFARKQPIALAVFDLSALVKNLEHLLCRLVGPRIDLTIEAAPGAWVHADAAQLEQVLVNLVANARDAMPAGGPLTVKVFSSTEGAATRSLPQVELFVEDRGSGMDEHTRAHAFDPFFTTKTAGTGLGLASSYGIVQQHGGDIEIESREPRGTRFRVRLPRSSAPTPQTQSVRPPASPSAGTILVVDDEPIVRKTAVRLLARLGYETLVAADGDEALAIVSAHAGRIDAVLCDLAMPTRSGHEVVADLRRIRPDLRVLFVSGYSDTELQRTPGTDFLPKPHTRAELGARLRALIDG
ncbi:MAG: response regulator [Deltaproteobacteria bacterium]|nr:response regulator [Deltaproteobacteria bacterium]